MKWESPKDHISTHFVLILLVSGSESTMHVHDTKAAGWDLGLDSRHANGLELSRTSHEGFTTGFVVNYENFLKPQIYQTHNKDTHNYFQTCKLFKYFKLFVVRFFWNIWMLLLEIKNKSMPRFLSFGLLILSATFLNNNSSSSIALLTRDCPDFKDF